MLAPGDLAGVTTIYGDYDLLAGALEIELFGSGGVAGTDFDRLLVTDETTLGATANLNLLLHYAPRIGDSYLIVDNVAPASGVFANDDALAAEFGSLRYGFSIDYIAGDGNDIAVTVTSVALIGDYNADGLVDAADYSVWRDAYGTNVAAYAGADGNGDGFINEADHALWAAHYGATLAAALAQAVPEPAAATVLTVLGVLIGSARRRWVLMSV